MGRSESFFEQLPATFVETSKERSSRNQMAEENGKQSIMITWTLSQLIYKWYFSYTCNQRRYKYLFIPFAMLQ